MAKWINSAVHDNGLQLVIDRATAGTVRVVALLAYTSGDSYATVTGAGNILADATLAGGDFTLAAGDVSGRKITSGSKSTTVDVEGDPTHLAWIDDTNSAVLFVTDESTSQTIYVGNAVTLPAMTFESRDPT